MTDLTEQWKKGELPEGEKYIQLRDIAVSFRGLSSAYTRPLGRRSNNSGNSVKM